MSSLINIENHCSKRIYAYLTTTSYLEKDWWYTIMPDHQESWSRLRNQPFLICIRLGNEIRAKTIKIDGITTIAFHTWDRILLTRSTLTPIQLQTNKTSITLTLQNCDLLQKNEMEH